jgi:hypothetical protein
VRTNAARWGTATVAVAAALQLSGSRFALGLAILVGIVTLVRERRRAVGAVAALALGLLLGVAIGAVGGATTGSGRVQAGGESVGATARLRVWASAAHAIADHPVLGAGPGRFRAATSKHRDLALVHAEGADRRFFDAHNVVVEYATTIGVLGLGALVLWVGLASRRARGPLFGFFLLVLAMHLVEPQSVGLTPLALLALGVAGRADVASLGRAGAAVTALLVLAAVVAAGRLLWGDYELKQASLDFSAGPAQAAVRALPPWPEPAELAGRVALFRSITTNAPAAQRDTLRWNQLATRRDPTDPLAWASLGEAQLHFGESRPAARSFRRALRWDPWSVRTLNGLGNAAEAEGDLSLARSALGRSLRADSNQPKVRAQLERLSVSRS